MKKLLLLGAVALLTSAFVATGFAEQPPVPTEPTKMALTKKPVTFKHSVHAALKCADCHHEVDGKPNFQPCAASGCHDKLGNKDKSVNSYYRAMHDKKVQFNSCISCHTKVVAEKKDKKKAMTGCVDSSCHPKA